MDIELGSGCSVGVDVVTLSGSYNSKYINSTSKMLEGKLAGENKRILKNLLLLGFTFILLFIAFMSTVNLQSTLNAEGGLGAYSLASMYCGVTVSSLFLPTLMMKKLKCKATLLVSMVGYFIYVGAQLYPKFYTLIPAGFILGLCISPLWTAQSTYVSRIAEEYAFLTLRKEETVNQEFFGIFFLLNQSAYIWGNIILSFILTPDSENEASIYAEMPMHCGINYCPTPDLEIEPAILLLHQVHNHTQTNFTNMKTDESKVYTLIGIYLGCIVAAAGVLAFFVDSLKRYGEDDEYEFKNKPNPTTKELLLSTFHQCKNPNQILLIPLSLLFGISIGIYGVDFTAGYVSCAWGVNHLGHVMIIYGISAALSSFCLGELMQFTGRILLFLLVAVVNIVAIIILILWNPNPDEYYVFFLVGGLWGITEGFWSPQISALYSSIFPDNKEAAFSNIRLWQSIGFIIAYINGTKFCMSTKLYIGIAIIIISTIGYLIVEFRVRKCKNPNSKVESGGI